MIRSPPLVIPSIRDIRSAPERASLVILQAALVVAARAIAVEHPSAVSSDDPRIFGPASVARARDLLEQFGELTESLERYLAAVDNAAGLARFSDDEAIF